MEEEARAWRNAERYEALVAELRAVDRRWHEIEEELDQVFWADALEVLGQPPRSDGPSDPGDL